jgi:Protein of unknown function (DUF1524)
LSKVGKDNTKNQLIFNELEAFLSLTIPTKDEYLSRFNQLVYLSNKTRNKALIKYILVLISEDQISGLDIDYSSLTIEHLIPESDIFDESDENVIGSIGNLILINSKTNSDELKNKNSKEKYEILIKLNYPLERNFVDSDNWNKDFIEHRCLKIADFIYNRIKLKKENI